MCFFCWGLGVYARGERGVDACPSGSVPISDPAECQAAAVSFGLTYETASNDGNDNSICFWCGACSPQKVKIANSHGPGAEWFCVSIPPTLSSSLTPILPCTLHVGICCEDIYTHSDRVGIAAKVSNVPSPNHAQLFSRLRIASIERLDVVSRGRHCRIDT